METYDIYIWSAYGITAVIMLLLSATSYRLLRRHTKELDILRNNKNTLKNDERS